MQIKPGKADGAAGRWSDGLNDDAGKQRELKASQPPAEAIGRRCGRADAGAGGTRSRLRQNRVRRKNAGPRNPATASVKRQLEVNDGISPFWISTTTQLLPSGFFVGEEHSCREQASRAEMRSTAPCPRPDPVCERFGKWFELSDPLPTKRERRLLVLTGIPAAKGEGGRQSWPTGRWNCWSALVRPR